MRQHKCDGCGKRAWVNVYTVGDEPAEYCAECFKNLTYEDVGHGGRFVNRKGLPHDDPTPWFENIVREYEEGSGDELPH